MATGESREVMGLAMRDSKRPLKRDVSRWDVECNGIVNGIVNDFFSGDLLGNSWDWRMNGIRNLLWDLTSLPMVVHGIVAYSAYIATNSMRI